jgi:predicted nucleic acid-binding protein
VRAGPKVRHRARGGDEVLHRADRDRQQRRAAVGGDGKTAGHGRGEVEVVVDRVVGHAAVGRQQPPQLGQPAGQLGPEAPQRERRPAQVRGIDVGAQMVGADCLRVGCGHVVRQPLRQAVRDGGQRVDQHRLVGEPDLLPRRVAPVALGLGEGRAVGSAGPVVGALEGCPHGRRQPGGEQLVEQRAHGAALVALARAHQHQRLLGRVVQPRRQARAQAQVLVVVHACLARRPGLARHIWRCMGGRCVGVLVDTTLWIDLLRARATPAVARLREVIDLEEAALAPVVMQEILQGSREDRAFRKLAAEFRRLPRLGLGDPLVLARSAAMLDARARWRGITPPSPHDCLIAAIAVDERAPLLADDVDFERLQRIEPRLRMPPH